MQTWKWPPVAVQGGFSFSGQSCISVQRILVQRTVIDAFLPMLVDHARALRVGDPLDETTDVGPLITPDAAHRVETWVREALDSGARLLTGGKRDGNIIHPTVLTDTKPTMRVNCFEVFGPVVTVEPYDTFEEAIRLVNDSPYGLQAGNDIPSFLADHMPYGGTKDSGLGREGSKYAIEEMTERKTLVLNLNC